MKKSRSHVGVMATAVFSSIWPVAIGVGLSLLIVKLAFPHAAFEARPAHSRSQGSQSQSIYAIAGATRPRRGVRCRLAGRKHTSGLAIQFGTASIT